MAHVSHDADDAPRSPMADGKRLPDGIPIGEEGMRKHAVDHDHPFREPI